MGLHSEGTGLGLYLVDTLIDRYEGDVWIEDNDQEDSVRGGNAKRRIVAVL